MTSNGPSQNNLILYVYSIQHNFHKVCLIFKATVPIKSVDQTLNKKFVYNINDIVLFQMSMSENPAQPGDYRFLVSFVDKGANDKNISAIKYTHKYGNDLNIDKCFRIDDPSWHLIRNYNEEGDNLFKKSFCITLTLINSDNASDSQQNRRTAPCASLHDDTILTDIEMRGIDGSVHMHKAIAAAASPVLRSMFSGKWRETAEGVIELPETTQATLQHFKDHIYLDTLPETGCEQLLLLASYYMMTELEQRCINTLLSKLIPENINNMIEFAVKHNVRQLLRGILERVQHGSIRVDLIP